MWMPLAVPGRGMWRVKGSQGSMQAWGWDYWNRLNAPKPPQGVWLRRRCAALTPNITPTRPSLGLKYPEGRWLAATIIMPHLPFHHSPACLNPTIATVLLGISNPRNHKWAAVSFKEVDKNDFISLWDKLHCRRHLRLCVHQSYDNVLIE